MPFILEAVDLDDVIDNEDMVYGWVAHAAKNGRIFYGYSGNPYIHQKYGDIELYSCIVWDDAEQKNTLEQFDLHVSGPCMWDMRISDIGLKNDTPYEMTRLTAVKSASNGGFTILHLLNADILPSFLEDDPVKAQVVAFALDVNYYKDEDAFAETVPECEGMKFEELNGKKLLPAMGSVLPNGFMHDHTVHEDGTALDISDNDDIVLVTGIVKHVFVDTATLEDENLSRYLRTQIETQYGDLDIVHSKSMISDEEFELLRTVDPDHPQIIVQAVAVLSGDVAINEYENGIIKDKEHDLAALRYALVKGNADRLKTILADDVIYQSVNSENLIQGKDAVVEHLNYVHDNMTAKFSSRFGNLTDDSIGERCIILEYSEERFTDSIVLIDVSEEGMIKKIEVSDAASKPYIVDEEPQCKEWWED